MVTPFYIWKRTFESVHPFVPDAKVCDGYLPDSVLTPETYPVSECQGPVDDCTRILEGLGTLVNSNGESEVLH